MLPTVLAVIKLLLCIVIAKNVVLCSKSTNFSEAAQKPQEIKGLVILKSSQVLPTTSQVNDTTVTPVESRIVHRTTILKRANHFYYQDNSTSPTQTLNCKEDDSTPRNHQPESVSSDSPTPKTMEFRPSVHLGEIDDYETRKSSTNPFSNVQHVKFESSLGAVESDTDRVPAVSTSSSLHEAEQGATVEGRKKKNRVKLFETDSRYGIAVPVENPHHQQEYYHQQGYYQPQQYTEQQMESNDSDNDDTNSDYNYPAKMPVGHALVTFEYPQSHYGDVTARPAALGRPAYPSIMSEEMHAQSYEPGIDNVQTIYVKPSKFQGEVEIVTSVPVTAAPVPHYDYVTPANGEAIEKPEVHHHHQDSYRVIPQETVMDNIGKPETVLYLTSHRETAYTRMRKFPYQFYHPGLGYQDNDYHYVQEVPHSYPSKVRRIPPWKKILHLVGTFLPLGLLLATLTPNVVKIGNNNTEPNIVLSKLRVVDLPVEHKRGRLVDEPNNQQQNTCEDRLICELIVSGSEPTANFLQHILWTLTTNSSDEEARKHGLHEIFVAVKKKDCSTIDC